mmetsp:Transcript_31155/g.74315  ORF Transcript_31155/g.74315 Transcript_31155/m.74315 type:complete len:278 (+) Transcript_31155:353-1186(+)
MASRPSLCSCPLAGLVRRSCRQGSSLQEGRSWGLHGSVRRAEAGLSEAPDQDLARGSGAVHLQGEQVPEHEEPTGVVCDRGPPVRGLWQRSRLWHMRSISSGSLLCRHQAGVEPSRLPRRGLSFEVRRGLDEPVHGGRPGVSGSSHQACLQETCGETQSCTGPRLAAAGGPEGKDSRLLLLNVDRRCRASWRCFAGHPAHGWFGRAQCLDLRSDVRRADAARHVEGCRTYAGSPCSHRHRAHRRVACSAGSPSCSAATGARLHHITHGRLRPGCIVV